MKKFNWKVNFFDTDGQCLRTAKVIANTAAGARAQLRSVMGDVVVIATYRVNSVGAITA